MENRILQLNVSLQFALRNMILHNKYITRDITSYMLLKVIKREIYRKIRNFSGKFYVHQNIVASCFRKMFFT